MVLCRQGEGYPRNNSPSCARSLSSSYFWYAQTLGEKLITPQSQAQKLTVRKCMDTPCLTSTPGTVVAIPLRCNLLDHLPRCRIILHDMKRRPVRPHMIEQRPICMRCRNVHERSVASQCIGIKEHFQVHIIDDDTEQCRILTLSRTCASHNGAEPRSKVCREYVYRFHCSFISKVLVESERRATSYSAQNTYSMSFCTNG